jgi:hypothetical protein
MGIDKTEKLLLRFGYVYQRHPKSIEIKLDFSHQVTIDFSDPENIKITDRLIGWNFLTGLLQMNLKNAILITLIGLAILAVLLSVFGGSFDTNQHLYFLFLMYCLWVTICSFYYLIKFEALKQQLIRWNENV